jgi:hypothetical protein
MPDAIFEKMGVWIGLAIMLVSLLNGSVYYLKKIGVLEQDSYQKYWDVRCYKAFLNQDTSIKQCNLIHPQLTLKEKSEISYQTQSQVDKKHFTYIYKTTSLVEKSTKIAKDLLFFSIITFYFFHLLKSRTTTPSISKSYYIYIPLVFIIATSTIRSILQHDYVNTLYGLRSFEFFILLLVITPFLSIKELEQISKYYILLLALQVILFIPELQYGLNPHEQPFIRDYIPERLSGSFIMPNTLGVASALGFMLYYCLFYWRWSVFILCAILVAAANSGTGFILLMISMLFHIAKKLRKSNIGKQYFSSTILLLFFIFTVLVFNLPALLDRPDLFRSITGRIELLMQVINQVSFQEALIGKGMGIGTNAAGYTSDSTISQLLLQIGILGVLAFYFLLFMAFHKTTTFRLFLIGILLASFILNINELFPINLLLTLVLAAIVNNTHTENHAYA